MSESPSRGLREEFGIFPSIYSASPPGRAIQRFRVGPIHAHGVLSCTMPPLRGPTFDPAYSIDGTTRCHSPMSLLRKTQHSHFSHPRPPLKPNAVLPRPAARNPVGRRSPCSSAASGRRPTGWAAGRLRGRAPRGPSRPYFHAACRAARCSVVSPSNRHVSPLRSMECITRTR
jgi:hypothetical protein